MYKRYYRPLASFGSDTAAHHRHGVRFGVRFCRVVVLQRKDRRRACLARELRDQVCQSILRVHWDRPHIRLSVDTPQRCKCTLGLSPRTTDYYVTLPLVYLGCGHDYFGYGSFPIGLSIYPSIKVWVTPRKVGTLCVKGHFQESKIVLFMKKGENEGLFLSLLRCCTTTELER